MTETGDSRATAGACAAAAAAALLCAAAPRAGEFFPTHVENMFTRAFYLPSPSDDRLADGLDASAAFSISNTVNAEQRGQESLFADGELPLAERVLREWRVRLELPIIHDGGGFLDQTIESWHRFFGFTQGSRPFYPKNQLHYDYLGLAGIAVDRPSTSIGGLTAETGWFSADSPSQTLSWWAGAQAPTGSVARLTGDGAWDGALWGHWARRCAAWQLGVEAGVAEPFGDEIFAGHAHHPVEFVRAAITRSLGGRWSLRGQLDGQSRRVDDSELRFLGHSLQLSLGASYQAHGPWSLDFGFTEDAAVNTAPDITFFLGVRHAAPQSRR